MEILERTRPSREKKDYHIHEHKRNITVAENMRWYNEVMATEMTGIVMALCTYTQDGGHEHEQRQRRTSQFKAETQNSERRTKHERDINKLIQGNIHIYIYMASSVPNLFLMCAKLCPALAEIVSTPQNHSLSRRHDQQSRNRREKTHASQLARHVGSVLADMWGMQPSAY